MRLTFLKLLVAVLCALVLLALGFFLIVVSYDAWLLQEMTVGRRRTAHRLLTFAANPTEFVLRSLFMTSLGLAFFSLGCIFLAGFVRRLWLFKGRFFQEASPPSVPMWWFAIPLLSFAVWFALLFILPTVYG